MSRVIHLETHATIPAAVVITVYGVHTAWSGGRQTDGQRQVRDWQRECEIDREGKKKKATP
jgi:hypothetical protein